MILALDTTAEFGSIALVRDGVVLEEVPVHAPAGFGHVLFDSIAALLRRHSASVLDIACFAAASGPGSFTGVRVGLSAVKGLAEAGRGCAMGISNLQALAFFGSAAVRAPVLDARRGEVYGGVYDNGLEPLRPETVGKFAEWLRALPAGAEVIANDPGPFRALVPDITAAPRTLASAVGIIAERRLAAGAPCDPAALDANYVRRADAELLWRG